MISNTWFQHHQRYLYAWKSPGDCTRNQIDYITINEPIRNSVTKVKSHPGADCGSDQNPIVATVKVIQENNEKEVTNKTANRPAQQQSHQLVSARIHDMVRTDEMETRYTKFSHLLIEATEQIVSVETRRANQRWMTNEILYMMEERRLLKHNQGLCRQKDAEIQR